MPLAEAHAISAPTYIRIMICTAREHRLCGLEQTKVTQLQQQGLTWLLVQQRIPQVDVPAYD